MTFPDFSPAPDQGGQPDLYELENRAMDPDGDVVHARFAYFWPPDCGAGRWEFTSRRDFEAVLRLEFPLVADSWLAGHPGALGLSYGYVLFAVGPEGDTTARSG